MASFLDTGLLGFFSMIFSVILVYTIIWGILQWRKPFGDNKGLYGIIALMAALLMIASPPARAFVEFIIPWFLALGIAFFLIIIVFSVFADIKWIDVIKDSTVHTIIIILMAIILIAGLANIFGQQTLEYKTGTPAPSKMPVMTENGTIQQGQIGNGAPQGTGNSLSGLPMPPAGVEYADNGLPQPGRVGPTATPEFETNLVNTLVHPKVLGMGLIFIISALIVFFLSKPAGGL